MFMNPATDIRLHKHDKITQECLGVDYESIMMPKNQTANLTRIDQDVLQSWSSDIISEQLKTFAKHFRLFKNCKKILRLE